MTTLQQRLTATPMFTPTQVNVMKASKTKMNKVSEIYKTQVSTLPIHPLIIKTITKTSPGRIRTKKTANVTLKAMTM